MVPPDRSRGDRTDLDLAKLTDLGLPDHEIKRAETRWDVHLFRGERPDRMTSRHAVGFASDSLRSSGSVQGTSQVKSLHT